MNDAETFALESQKIALEKYKARLDFGKFALGSVFAAIVIAAIPPLFQWATAKLEDARKRSEMAAKQQEFREDYVKQFVSNGLNQDIELRIRFAEYFSFVSTDQFRKDWIAYRESLIKRREEIRTKIDQAEAEWRQKVKAVPLDDAEIDRLERNLAWTYKEVGYVEKERGATSNPRLPSPSSTKAVSAGLRLNAYRVFVQFAGSLKREDVKAMMERIQDAGWNVQGTLGGGERTPAAAGYSEVRYSHADDELAAQTLAQTTQESSLVSRPVNIKLNSSVPKGVLEIWISR